MENVPDPFGHRDAERYLADTPTWKGAPIALVAAVTLGLAGWVYAWPLIGLVFREWAIYPNVGDAAIGILFLGVAVFGISSALLLTSICLCLVARPLPMATRILALSPSAAGCVVGALLLYRALAR